MLCPVCKNVNLAMTDRQGIEIDYCPTCRGVWLDRGELDRLIERAEQAAAPAPAPPRTAYASQPPPHHGQAHQHGHSHQGYDPRRKRHKSLLGELFDF
jgi:Zn-finger nucleic acid-binding protein